MNSQTFRNLDEHRRVLDIDDLLGWRLGDIQRKPKDVRVRNKGRPSILHVRLGRPGSRGCIRITDADINAFLASQKVGGEAPARAPPRQQKKVFKHVVIPK